MKKWNREGDSYWTYPFLPKYRIPTFWVRSFSNWKNWSLSKVKLCSNMGSVITGSWYCGKVPSTSVFRVLILKQGRSEISGLRISIEVRASTYIAPSQTKWHSWLILWSFPVHVEYSHWTSAILRSWRQDIQKSKIKSNYWGFEFKMTWLIIWITNGSKRSIWTWKHTNLEIQRGSWNRWRYWSKASFIP